MESINNIQIFYFSGTGNAKQIAQWFLEFSTNKEIPCEMVNIAKQKAPISISEDSLILIISPTHGFNFPKITLDFINRLPKGANRILLMNTRAGMKVGRIVTPGLTGIAFMLSSIILKLKGYKVIGEIPFDMPSNWLSIHPALNSSTVNYLFEKNYQRAESYFNKLLEHKTLHIARRDVVQDVLISPISIGYYLIGRFLFAKSFFADSHCNSCGVCVKQCPVQAIQMKNHRPFWTFNCESCMHCMNVCPTRAIQTAHGLLIFVSVLTSILTTYLISQIVVPYIPVDILDFMVSTVLLFLNLALFYRIQHFFLRVPFFARIISYSSLTIYRFWGRYYAVSEEKWKK